MRLRYTKRPFTLSRCSKMRFVPRSTVLGQVAKMCAMICSVRTLRGCLAVGNWSHLPAFPQILRSRSALRINLTARMNLLLGFCCWLWDKQPFLFFVLINVDGVSVSSSTNTSHCYGLYCVQCFCYEMN